MKAMYFNTKPGPRRFAHLFAASALTAALSACAVGPNYVWPESTLPANFVHAPTTAAPTAQLEVWWQSFQDPVLNQIIERVLAENLDLAASQARVAQARAVAHMADARLLPQGELAAQAATERQSLNSPLGKIAHAFPGYNRDQTLYDLGAGASWELDLSGGLHRQQEADHAEAEAAEADGLGVRVSVAAEAADAYFRVRGAQRRIALAEEQIKTDESLLALIDLRVHEGLATRREQAEAEARLAQVRASVPRRVVERDVQLNRLDVLMGAQPGSYAAALATPAQDVRLPTMTAMPAPESLLRRRPDVLAAERRLAASNARIGAAMSEYYPKFSLSALLGFESLQSARASSATFQPQAVAGLHWRLFDFGRVDAEVAQAKGGNAEALARYRQAMLRATEDVENALLTQAQLDTERHELQREIAADADARSSAEDAYTGGTTSLLEVLEQDRQLLSARDQLASTDTDTARAVVATYRALGGGW